MNPSITPALLPRPASAESAKLTSNDLHRERSERADLDSAAGDSSFTPALSRAREALDTSRVTRGREEQARKERAESDAERDLSVTDDPNSTDDRPRADNQDDDRVREGADHQFHRIVLPASQLNVALLLGETTGSPAVDIDSSDAAIALTIDRAARPAAGSVELDAAVELDADVQLSTAAETSTDVQLSTALGTATAVGTSTHLSATSDLAAEAPAIDKELPVRPGLASNVPAQRTSGPQDGQRLGVPTAATPEITSDAGPPTADPSTLLSSASTPTTSSPHGASPTAGQPAELTGNTESKRADEVGPQLGDPAISSLPSGTGSEASAGEVPLAQVIGTLPPEDAAPPISGATKGQRPTDPIRPTGSDLLPDDIGLPGGTPEASPVEVGAGRSDETVMVESRPVPVAHFPGSSVAPALDEAMQPDAAEASNQLVDQSEGTPDSELWDQVQRAFGRLRPGIDNQELRLRLQPAELGELLVQVQTRGDHLAVRLVASSPAAQQTLLDDQQRLAAELAKAGFENGFVDIGHQNQPSNGERGRSPNAQPGDNSLGGNPTSNRMPLAGRLRIDRLRMGARAGHTVDMTL